MNPSATKKIPSNTKKETAGGADRAVRSRGKAKSSPRSAPATGAGAAVATPRSEFAGAFVDLPDREKRAVAWGRELSSTLQEPHAKPAMSPTLEQPRLRSKSLKQAKKFSAKNLLASDLNEARSTLYLVRSSRVTAAQALNRSNVSCHPEARKSQTALLKEYRKETRETATSEINRWIEDQLPGRPAAQESGAIGAGVVVPMTEAEAKRLSTDVPGLLLLRNRALTLISPTVLSSPVKSYPNDAGWHLEAIGMSAARRDGKSYSGRDVVIALMDTGVQLDHPELAGKVRSAWKIRENPNTTDFDSLEIDSAHYDTDGHGTHVAGIICGQSAGVAPDSRIVSILMMPQKMATTFDFIRCLDWAAEHPEIGLVNFSAGVTPFSPDMMPFISDLIATGALPIIAVGNDGPNNTRSPGNYVDGLSVGSADAPGQKVSAFSGSGLQLWNQTQYPVPDCVAPGAAVWSSAPGSRYVAMSGTSMATPVVTGIAACIIEQTGGMLTPLELVDLITHSCRKLAGEADLRQGAGLIQAPVRT